MRRWCARRMRMRASARSTTARGARRRRRARGAHRRRSSGRRAEADPAPAAAARPARHHAAQSRRQRAVDHAALSAAGRQGPLRRRGGGDGGRHVDRRRQGRRRAGRRRLRAARSRSPARWRRPSNGAPAVFNDGSNICIDAEVGDAAATEAAFTRAAHVVALDTQVQRVTGVPMEPRAAVGVYDARDRPLHAARRQRQCGAAEGRARRHPRRRRENAVRVVARDVGGNFGTRNAFYPEFALVCWAARRLGRPVKWTCERSESFLSDYQGRDLAVQAELALDADGNFLALRGTNTSNVGAHTVSFVALGQGRRADVERLQDPGRAFPRPRGADQHAADQFLSQRRPARGDVRDRAADRSRRHAMRLRPGVAAAAQSRAGAAALLRQSARADLRRRRLQEGDGRRA